MNIPTLPQAETYLPEAQALNPGPWVHHSIWAARAAQAIATHHPDIDPAAAYILGLLHDIGRRVGVTGMRHTLDGYRFLQSQGFEDAARSCLTHSFPIKDVAFITGKWDGSAAELRFVEDYLARIEYTVYDRLIQLADTVALPSGFCLIEKRFVDVTLRYGFNVHTLQKWRAFLDLRQEFEAAIHCSIYAVLPGVVENTFGNLHGNTE